MTLVQLDTPALKATTSSINTQYKSIRVCKTKLKYLKHYCTEATKNCLLPIRVFD